MIIIYCADYFERHKVCNEYLAESAATTVLWCLAAFAFICCINVGILLFVDSDNFKHTHYEISENIISMKDGSGISGNFFLGCGSLNGELVYSFYAQDSIGIHGRTIDSDRAILRYTTSQPRHVTYCKKYAKSDWLFTPYLFWEYPYKDILYIPEGSITNKIVLDLE